MNRPLDLVDASYEFPNDWDLGEYLRAHYGFGSSLNTTEIHEMVKEYHNNENLGAAARIFIRHS
jgi:hypothetical protein